ncbi:MAG: hypothetical protein KAU14_09625 [Thermoplasmata archaeon]|nr:hypothetical protein [Thermoplasmata archaeon]
MIEAEPQDRVIGYIGREGKAPALWWSAEREAQKELNEATLDGDDEIETATLINLFTALRPQLKIKKSGNYYNTFMEKAAEVGLFDLEEIPTNDYRNLFLLLEDYLTEVDAHQGDHRGDQPSNTRGIPPEWLACSGMDVFLDPTSWFRKGLATIITGENGVGKTNLMIWIALQLSQWDSPKKLRPVIATNLKLYKEWAVKHGIKIVRRISEVFDVVAEIDLSGERRNLYVLIDEFDGAEGQNAWETRGAKTGASFRVFNQFRKLQDAIIVPSIHYPQDVNNRWRTSSRGVHCIINKGMRYPDKGFKNVWDCTKIQDERSRLKSAAIYWENTPINLIGVIPNCGECFETYAPTTFTFDMGPKEVLEIMEAIDRIPMPEHGTEEERIEWMMTRGAVIKNYMEEWRRQREPVEEVDEAEEKDKEKIKELEEELKKNEYYDIKTWREANTWKETHKLYVKKYKKKLKLPALQNKFYRLGDELEKEK